MFVYNITTQVSWDIADEWLDWQREVQIPEIIATNLFDDHKMFRILEQEDLEGPTFTIQFFTTDQERYQQYINEFASIIRNKALARWKNQIVSHHTCMSLLD